jgi:hypothetical protein
MQSKDIDVSKGCMELMAASRVEDPQTSLLLLTGIENAALYLSRRLHGQQSAKAEYIHSLAIAALDSRRQTAI